MKACLSIFLVLGVALAPVLTSGQGDYAVRDGGAPVFTHAVLRPAGGERPGPGEKATYGEMSVVGSNVPLNEINIHAFRRMHRRYPGSMGEYWLKTAEGYLVSFTENSQRYQACFSLEGTFRGCLRYYAGKDAPADLTDLIGRKYPGYAIKVVTEITDGTSIFYRVNIENSSSVKTLSVTDGQIQVLEELINGGINNGPGR